jgi:hypothetical protein
LSATTYNEKTSTVTQPASTGASIRRSGGPATIQRTTNITTSTTATPSQTTLCAVSIASAVEALGHTRNAFRGSAPSRKSNHRICIGTAATKTMPASSLSTRPESRPFGNESSTHTKPNVHARRQTSPTLKISGEDVVGGCIR